MNLPVRRTSGRLAELPFPGWTRDPLAEFDDLFSRMESLLESTFGAAPAVQGGCKFRDRVDRPRPAGVDGATAQARDR
jgi:HSP20 family protein